MHLLVHWLIATVAVLLTAYFVPGFKVSSFGAAMVAAVVIGFVNMIIWPVLAFLTLPLTILTLGLFLLVVNGISLKIAAALSPGFEINGFMPAVLGSLVLTFIGWLIRFVLFNSYPNTPYGV